jgi:TonB family protein
MPAQLFRKPFRALCEVALLTASIPAIAQSTPPTQSASYLAESQQAIAVIASRSSVDAAVTVPNTKKPLPLDGSWNRNNATDFCPKTKYSCIHLLYRVPSLGVSCEWTVLLRETVDQGVILDMNEDAARYFTSKEQGGVSKNPPIEKISGRPPFLSPIAKAAHTNGSVKMLVHIDTSGHVDDVRVLSGPEMLRDTTVEAVKQWVYKPLVIDSVAFPFRFILTNTFNGF